MRVTRDPSRLVGSKRVRGKPTPPAPRPTITRLTGDTELVAPPGYSASVVLKLVDKDESHLYYAWWVLAGRHHMDKVSVLYKHTGGEAIRVDLPEGMPLSAESLQLHLKDYLAGPGLQAPDTPIIRIVS